MAVGKNKKLSKRGKGGKRKVADPMTKKEWYDVVAPAVYEKRQCTKTLCTKSSGNKLAADNLKGRVFEVSLGDLNEDESLSFRKVQLKVEDVQGRNCLTNFYGMTLTTDKLRAQVRKWCTLVEAVADVKTGDGYTLRLFCIGFTKGRPNQMKKNCYAQSSQVRQIRRKMTDIMVNTCTKSDLQTCVKKFGLELIGQEVEKACNGVYPLRDVMVRKVKVVKAPKMDPAKLLDIHDHNIPDSVEGLGVAAE